MDTGERPQAELLTVGPLHYSDWPVDLPFLSQLDRPLGEL